MTANLQVLKLGPSEVGPGGTFSNTLLVRNIGDTTATGIEVVDEIPSEVTITNLIPGGNFIASQNPSVVSFAQGTLAPGQLAILTIQGIVSSEATGTIQAMAVVDPNNTVDEGVDEDDNTATLTTSIDAEIGPDLRIFQIDSPDPIAPGDTVTYQLMVKNDGQTAATNIEVLDILPTGFNVSQIIPGGSFTATQAGNEIRFIGGSLASDESALLTIVGTTPITGGEIVNTAVVDPEGKITESDETNNIFSETTTLNANLLPDLSIITIGPPNPVAPGETIAYTLLVNNNGPGDASNIVARSSLLSGFTVTQMIPGGNFTATQESGVVSFTGGSLRSGNSAVFTIVGKVPQNVTGDLISTAVVDPDGEILEHNEDNNNTTFITSISGDGVGNIFEAARDIGLLSDEQLFRDFIGNDDERDIYQFNLNEEREVNINLFNLSADTDWYLLQERNGNSSSDGGYYGGYYGSDNYEMLHGSFNAGNADEVGSIVLQDGEYFLVVEQYEGDTNYDLTVSASQELSRQSETIDLGILDEPQTKNGEVGDANPIDRYSFILNNDSFFTSTLSGLSADADLYLIYDSNGNSIEDDADLLLASSWNGGNDNEEISLDLFEGSYIVVVEQYNGNTNYALTISTTDAPTSDAIDLGILDGTMTVNGEVGDEDPIDQYSFTLNGDSFFTSTLSGLSADADLYLIHDLNGNSIEDEGDEWLASSWNGGNDNEEIRIDLFEGSYIVVVEQYDGNTNYALTISTTDAPTSDAIDLGILDGTMMVNGEVTDANPIEQYSFTLNGDSFFTSTLSGLSADADLYLIHDLNGNSIEDEGEFIDGSWNGGNDNDIVSLRLADGEYLLVVEQFEGNTNYDLTISTAVLELQTLRDAIDLAPNNRVENSVGDSNPIDLYSFTLDSDSLITLTLDGLTEDADLYLIEDMDGDGQIDDEGPFIVAGEVVNVSYAAGTTPEEINELLPAGTYYVKVEQFEGNTDYDLTLTTQILTTADDNNTISDAEDLGILRDNSQEIQDRTVGANDQLDYYTFTLDTQSNLDVNVNVSGGDADLWLIQDSNGDGEVAPEEVIDVSDAPGEQSESIFIRDFAPGTYYIAVNQYSGNPQYDLTIMAQTANNPPDERPNNLSDALETSAIIPTETPQTFMEFVGVSDPEDWYRLTIQEQSSINISLTGMSADADLFLIADNGDVIVSSINYSNEDESIIRELDEGEYFVKVEQFQGDTEYELTVFAEIEIENRPGNSMQRAIAKSSPEFSASGEVSSEDLHDFYRFTVTESGIFTADLTDLSADADVRLIRDFNGNNAIDLVVDRNENGYIDREEVEIVAWQPNRDAMIPEAMMGDPGSRDETIRAFLEPGEYFLQVTSGPQKPTTNYNVETRFLATETDPQAFKIEVELSQGAQGAQETLNDTLEDAVEKASEFWERVITHSTFDGEHNISINVNMEDLDERVLAEAGPTDRSEDENGNLMSVEGEVTINSNIVEGYEQDPQLLYETMIHEFAHVLGFIFDISTKAKNIQSCDDLTDAQQDQLTQAGIECDHTIHRIWCQVLKTLINPNLDCSGIRLGSSFSLRDRGLVGSSDEASDYIANSWAGIAYGELLQTFEPTAIPLTVGVGEGSDLSHWSGNVFKNEIMTESNNIVEDLLSSITIGAMQDLGYNVNYGAAEPYMLP